MIITDVDILHTVSVPISPDEYDDVFTKLEQELKNQSTGIGLSAVQIGIHKNAFVYYGSCENSECHEKHLFRVANPIIDYVGKQFFSKEGCLSIPGKEYVVKRNDQIVVNDDINGKYTLFVKDDMDAIVFQHEYDHCNGILISDVGIPADTKIGRNDKCPCGSLKNGKPVKYKNCHGIL